MIKNKKQGAKLPTGMICDIVAYHPATAVYPTVSDINEAGKIFEVNALYKKEVWSNVRSSYWYHRNDSVAWLTLLLDSVLGAGAGGLNSGSKD